MARATCSGSVTSPPPLSPTSSPWPTATSRPTLARSSTTSTRPPTRCSPTCPRATTRSAPSTGCLQDPDEDPAQLREGRDRGSDREEGHRPGPLRNPWQVHMETRLILSILCRNYERVFKLKLI